MDSLAPRQAAEGEKGRWQGAGSLKKRGRKNLSFVFFFGGAVFFLDFFSFGALAFLVFWRGH